MAEIVRRKSWGGVLPLGRHASIRGSSFIQCASVSIALSSVQEGQTARHHKQFKLEQALSWRVPAKSRHHAFPTVPFRRGHPNLRAAVPAAANLEPRWDAADRRDPGPWPTHRDEPVADHGAERGAALRQL